MITLKKSTAYNNALHEKVNLKQKLSAKFTCTRCSESLTNARQDLGSQP